MDEEVGKVRWISIELLWNLLKFSACLCPFLKMTVQTDVVRLGM